MKPHVDSIKFSGGTVAGLSLLTPCVFELHHEKSPAVVHVLLEPRTFYILRFCIYICVYIQCPLVVVLFSELYIIL